MQPPVRAAEAAREAPRRPGFDSCGYGVVVVASSTGGPDALSQILPHWDLHVPVLIVQHMPANFTKLLADRLDRCCPMPVVEAGDGDIVEPGRVLVAPGNFHLRLQGSTDRAEVHLTSEPLVNSLRPAADVTFRDVAAVWGSDVLGVVLTGMGRDGVVGARAIAAAGGMVLAQDEPTSAVWGMPGEVVDAGLATAVLPLERFATTVPTLCRRARTEPVSVPVQAGSVDLTLRPGH
ncbi:MAG: CheB methylesterase domain-containing protein [Mycobacteriales bacterium]